MSDLNRNITLKLIVDGKELTTTLSSGDQQFQEIISKAQKLNELLSGKTRQPMLDQFAKELLEINVASGEASNGIQEFIQVNQLSEKEVAQVIQMLETEKHSLATGSKEWREHSAAILNINNAYASVIKRQMELVQGGQQVRTAGSSMTATMGQLGYAIGDADMFFVNFRMGMMSVANNIPMVVNGFIYAAQNAKILGTTVKAELLASLAGPGGLLLTINGLMFLLNVLPRLFSESTKEIKKQKDEIKALKDEYAKLTEEQIKNRLNDINAELQKLEAAHPSTIKKIDQSGTGLSGREVTTSVSGEKRYGDDYERLQLLEKQKKALEDTGRDLGIIENIQNRINLNQNALNKLNENESSPFYYKNIVKTAQSYEEAKKTLEQWIAADQKLVEKNKAGTNKAFENAKEKLKIEQDHIENMAKLEGKGDAVLLQIKMIHYEEMIALHKKFNKDTTELQNQLIETQKEYEIKFGFDKLKTYDEIQKKKKLDPTGTVAGIPQDERDRIEIQNMENQFDRQRAQANLEYELQKKKFGDIEFLREQHRKVMEKIDREEFQYKISLIGQMLSLVATAYNNAYSMIAQNVKDDITKWKSSEQEKLNAERQAALNHARTAAQKQKINEQYDKRQQELEDESQKRAHERLSTWFAIQKAVNISQAIQSTYAGADKALATLPPPYSFIMAGITIATGLANVAVIAAQKMPAYKRGGINPKGQVGILEGDEAEFVAPLSDYASEQAKLINMTMHTVMKGMTSNTSLNSNSDNTALHQEIIGLRADMKYLLENPVAPNITRGAIQEMWRKVTGSNKKSKI